MDKGEVINALPKIMKQTQIVTNEIMLETIRVNKVIFLVKETELEEAQKNDLAKSLKARASALKKPL